MIDLKKATRKELIDLLLVDVRAIESMLEMRKTATYEPDDCKGYEYSLFIHEPLREIYVSEPLFQAVADFVRPDIVIEPPETRCGGESEYWERHFYLELLGQKYKIFSLFKEA